MAVMALETFGANCSPRVDSLLSVLPALTHSSPCEPGQAHSARTHLTDGETRGRVSVAGISCPVPAVLLAQTGTSAPQAGSLAALMDQGKGPSRVRRGSSGALGLVARCAAFHGAGTRTDGEDTGTP